MKRKRRQLVPSRQAAVFRNSGTAARRAFTLIELLVSVGVIAVLLSLLLPSLSQAREEAKGAHCAGVLHNAGLAMTMYLDENEGAFWPYYVDQPGPGGGRRWWFGFEPNGPPSNALQQNRPLDKTGGFLARYLTGTAKDFYCPSFPYGAGKCFPKFAPVAGGYGYNTGALAGYDQTAPRSGGTRRAQEYTGQTSDIFALADGVHFDRLDYSSSIPLDQTFNEPAYIQWQDPTGFGGNVGVNGGYAHFRHNRRAVVLFLDGHATGQPPRRDLHPYSTKGYGPIANLSDERLRTRTITRGQRSLEIDLIYGLK